MIIPVFLTMLEIKMNQWLAILNLLDIIWQCVSDHLTHYYQVYYLTLILLADHSNMKQKTTILTNFLNTFTNDKDNQQLTFITTAKININATTRGFHCEKDNIYYHIFIPKQKDTDAHIIFQFRINCETTLHLKVQQHGVFTYSAYCLAHRQLATSFGDNCMNISTYSAKSV